EEVVRIVNAQRSALYLVNPESNELEATASVGVDKKLLKFDYRKGLAGQVFTSGISMNVGDQSEDNRVSTEFDEIIGVKTRSVICNPITNREEKIIGVIEVVNKRSEDHFSVEDEKIMKVVALVFSSVFHNYNPISSESIIRKFSAPTDRQHVIIGRSKHIANLRNSIVKLKDIDTPVYIHGEPGTGKALLGRVLHVEGKRGLKVFDEVQCGGEAENILDQMLFGSSADGTEVTIGKLERCDGGTLLFREIHLLPFIIQRKLLEVLSSGKLPQWKGKEEFAQKNLDVRVVATSCKCLDKMVVEGRFNRALYDYLAKSFVVVPPLRKREDDIKELITHFIKMECKKQGFLIKTLAPSVLKNLLEYEWPGNIRELRACIERIVLYNPKNHVITSLGGNLATPVLEERMGGGHFFDEIPHASDSSIVLKDRMALIERHIILGEIRRHNGNKSRAAREMGISREALRKKMMLSNDIMEALDGYKAQQQKNKDKEKKAA
ncbi:MAG: sigma-54-dependent Fis family transcriptional regulator, partial [Oligoflexia bacterium]|nr:sigma-54-dependent Fis family transcriptional regulator [Oligoflexia bacterium]